MARSSMADPVSIIREKHLEILGRIESAARSRGRAPAGVRLVVVSKSQPVEVVQAALDAGVAILGENYPEEGVMKIQSVRAQPGVEWHMIGHVQSRKAELAARNFNLIHSLDSLKLAERLNRIVSEFGRRLPVLLEFNVGGEDSKYGWDVHNEAGVAAMLPELSSLLGLAHLDVRGLMTMPPIGATSEASRPYFQKLRELRDYLERLFPETTWSELSMGTSIDFETAVQEGATLVRVGTAILGSRTA